MVLRELITKFGFDVDDKGLKSLEDGVNNVKNSILAVGAVAAAAAGTLFGIAKTTANTGDVAAKTARSIGLTAERLQELSFAAEIGGVNQTSFAGALQKLSRSASEAADGVATYKDTYDELGINVKKSNGEIKNSDELLNEVSDAFSKLPDGTRKTALAMDLMGRSGAKMITVLNGGSDGLKKLSEEAQASGFVISEADSVLSEEFNDSLTRLTNVITGLKNTIGVSLLRPIKGVVDQIKLWVLANSEVIKQNLALYIEKLITIVKVGFTFFKRIFEVTTAIVSLFGGWEKVIKFVTFAMLGLLGAGFILGLGQIAIGLFNLIRAFDILKLKILLTNLSALAMPLLIGAAIVALGLIIEDLVAFFKGEDSVTGQIVKAFTGMFESLENKFSGFGGFVKGVLAVIFAPIRGIIAGIRTISGIAGSLAGGGGISGAFDALKQGASDLFNPLSGDTSIQGVLGFGEKKAANNTSKVNEIKPTINIKNENGLTTEQTQKATQAGIKDALGGLLRETDRQFETPVLE